MKKYLFALGLTVFQLNAQTNDFPSSGNVGIGTTNSSNALTINGGAFSNGAHALVLEREIVGGTYNNIKASLGISGNLSQGGLRFFMKFR